MMNEKNLNGFYNHLNKYELRKHETNNNNKSIRNETHGKTKNNKHGR